jgi:hypothetical protein
MRSLAGRLLLLGILPSALVIGGILGWGMVDKYHALGRIAESELEHQALAIAVDVAESNLSAIQAARSIAVQQESGLFGDRARTIDILRGLLAADGNVTAAYVAYEPDADGKDAASLATDPKEWMDAAGRFIPYPFRDWQRGDRREAVGRLRDEPLLRRRAPRVRGHGRVRHDGDRAVCVRRPARRGAGASDRDRREVPRGWCR